MPHLLQGTKRGQRFTTVLAIAAFLTFPAHMVGQERVDPMATTVGQSFAMIEQSFIALADAMPAASVRVQADRRCVQGRPDVWRAGQACCVQQLRVFQ